MSELPKHIDCVDTLYNRILAAAHDDRHGHNVQIILQYLSGAMVEYALMFDSGPETLEAQLENIARSIESEAYGDEMPAWALDLPETLDLNAENGRMCMRDCLIQWPACEFELGRMLVQLCSHFVLSWEEDGIPRAESYRILIEYSYRALAFEVAAQELCDSVIEILIGGAFWSLGDAISGMSGVAGRRLAIAPNRGDERDEPDNKRKSLPVFDRLDPVMHVMTREATRLGLPASSDWRFGLAANDCPVNPPRELIDCVAPLCERLFSALNINCAREQAVACAKATGRMIAVASGGEDPEMAPAISKPLATAAMSETFKSGLVQSS